jgi:hypothetical protein
MAHILAKKYGHHTMLRWCHTNLGLLYMMVPSDWQGNFVLVVLLAFTVCQQWGPYRDPDQQGEMVVYNTLVRLCQFFRCGWK